MLQSPITHANSRKFSELKLVFLSHLHPLHLQQFERSLVAFVRNVIRHIKATTMSADPEFKKFTSLCDVIIWWTVLTDRIYEWFNAWSTWQCLFMSPKSIDFVRIWHRIVSSEVCNCSCQSFFQAICRLFRISDSRISNLRIVSLSLKGPPLLLQRVLIWNNISILHIPPPYI